MTHEAAAASLELRAIGTVQSPLSDPALAPRQGDEGGPEAVLAYSTRRWSRPRSDLRPGSEVFVLTWLHLARRDVLSVHPRDNPANPLTGVFSHAFSGSAEPDRPAPGDDRGGEGTRIRVRDLEAIDGTPVVDVKPVLRPDGR